MRKTKYTVKPTTQFKKDYKLAMKRGLKIKLLEDVVSALAMGEPLPDKNKDHALTGNWIGHRECHILPDWLLIYRIEDDVLVLTLARTGTHSDLFGKLHTDRCMEEISVRRFCLLKAPVRPSSGSVPVPLWRFSPTLSLASPSL